MPLWKNHRFVGLVIGQTISQAGTAMTTFVIPWFLLQLTGSAVQTGVLFAIGYLPYIVVVLPAGAFADRANRKMLMILANTARLLLLTSIPLTHFLAGTTPIYLLYIVQAGVSGFSAVFDAAYGTVIPAIVSSNQVREANSVLQSGSSASRIVGPILGGAVMTLIGPANTILADVFSYVIAIAAIVGLTMRPSTSSSMQSPEQQSPARQSIMQSIQEGITTVWGIKPLRSLMVSSFLVNLVGPGMDIALLYHIQHDLNLKSQWAGIIMTGLSVGMLVGSLINQQFGKKINVEVWLKLSAVLQIIPPILLAFVGNPIAIVLIQTLIGILLAAWNIQSVTLRHTLVPNALLGRCTSVFRLSAWISIPVGDALAGVVSDTYGTKVYFIISACVLLLAAVLKISLNSPKVVAPLPSSTTSRM